VASHHNPEPDVHIAVLGPTEVRVRGAVVHPTQQDVRVLTALVALDGEVESSEVEALAWNEPPTPRALQSAVYRLRKLLGDDVVVTRRRRLELNRRRCTTDLQEFLALASITSWPSGEYRTERAGLVAAACLLRGEPFDTLEADTEDEQGSHRDGPWAEARDRWSTRIDDMADRLTRLLVSEGQAAQAARLAAEHLSWRPRSPRRAARLVDLLIAEGRTSEAMAVVEHTRKEFSAAGLPTPPEVSERERRILRGELLGAHVPGLHGTAPAGRRREFNEVMELLHGPERRIPILLGPAGIGKTFLLRAIVAAEEARGTRVVHLRGQSHLPTTLVEALRLLLPAIDPQAQPDGDVYRLSDQVVAAAQHSPVPLLVVIDDGESIDPDAVTKMAALWHRCAATVKVIFATDHLDPALEAVAASIRLRFVTVGPLERGSVEELLVAHEASCSEAEVDDVSAATSGLPSLVTSYVRLRRTAPHSVAVASVCEERLVQLEPLAAELVRVVSVTRTPLPIRTLATLLGLSVRCALDAAAEGVERGLVTVTADGVVPHSARSQAMVVDGMAPADQARIARVVLPALTHVACPAELVTSARLHLLADPENGWELAVGLAVRAISLVDEFDTRSRSTIARQMMAELEAIGAPSVAMCPFLLEDGLAMELLGRPEDGVALIERAYRCALEAGDVRQAIEVAVRASESTLSAVTDRGETARALVNVWRSDPGAPTAVERIRLDALAAMHELVRHDAQVGQAMARDAIARARAVGDDDLTAWVIATLTSDQGADRSLDDEVAWLITYCRTQGQSYRLTRAQVYRLCARMRRQEATFADPAIEELALFAEGHPGSRLQLRHDLMRIARATLEGRCTHVLEGVRIVRATLPATLPPLLTVPLGLAEALCRAPRWADVAPADLIGDPARLDLSAPTDQWLSRAAAALAAGDRPAVGLALAHLTGSVEQGATSPISQVRLPLLALVLRGLGAVDVAAEHLAANLHLRGRDLCMLPAVHLGPADSWLAMMADTAGQATLAAELHRAARARLAALGAGVLELGR